MHRTKCSLRYSLLPLFALALVVATGCQNGAKTAAAAKTVAAAAKTAAKTAATSSGTANTTNSDEWTEEDMIEDEVFDMNGDPDFDSDHDQVYDSDHDQVYDSNHDPDFDSVRDASFGDSEYQNLSSVGDTLDDSGVGEAANSAGDEAFASMDSMS